MNPTPTAEAHQRRRERMGLSVARAAAGAWARIDQDDIRGSWSTLLPDVVAAVAAAQMAAASATEPWLVRLLGEEHVPPEADRINPRGLSGVTLDGRPLLATLLFPAISALSHMARGAPLATALAAGRALLDLTVRTLVADTGRAADRVGMITRPAVTSYIRVVDSGSCDRCVVLAGAEYGISTGFQRHPQCGCTMEPVTRDHAPTPQDPRAVFDRMSPEQQERRFTEAGARAIREGADPGQVVNARRGMSTTGQYRRRTTTEGVTRRGVAGRQRRREGREGGPPRLTPEEIYRQADSRTHAIELLRQHSYLL